MDLVEQGLEAFVFGEPCTDLGQEGLGDVEGAGFAVFLEGEVLSGVSGTAGMAAAAGSSAAMGVAAEVAASFLSRAWSMRSR
jgi:hypothetical protein